MPVWERKGLPVSTLIESLQRLEANANNDFRRIALTQILLPLIPGERVLDVGCGMGFMTEALVRSGRQVVPLDIERSLVHHTNQRINRYVPSGNGTLYAGYAVPFADQSFDTIVCLDVIEHVEDDLRLVKEFRRLLRPGGHLVLTVPALQLLYGQRDKHIGHYRRYDKPLLRERLAAAGFEVMQLEYWNMLGVGPYFVSERLLGRELPDTIRKGESSPLRRVIASALVRWLILERRFSLPFGLSLIAVGKKR
jgi:2-polyprenyl-3-methyl-5-hydroxy-6-metoxy-1,4-benzoquinol methylase